MKKEIYVCDCCGKPIRGNNPNVLLLFVNLEKHRKELCDNCTNEKLEQFNAKKW